MLSLFRPSYSGQRRTDFEEIQAAIPKIKVLLICLFSLTFLFWMPKWGQPNDGQEGWILHIVFS
jgi:hypothetical protein